MKLFTLILFSSFLFFQSCKKENITPNDKRFFEKIEITNAKMTGWDVLSGPDMKLYFRDNLIDSLATIGESEQFEDVAFLPLTFDSVAFELTDFIDFQVRDVDQFAPDQVMFQKSINGYARSEEGNPFVIGDSEWTIKIYWKN